MTFFVNFVDTSVLVELLAVPGKSQHAEHVRNEFAARVDQGQRFILPIATIIETGNHISQATGDRHQVASAFERLLRGAIDGDGPFAVEETRWNETFLSGLLAGASVGDTFAGLASSGRFGVGDLSIILERDLYVERSNYQRSQVRIWTLEAEMQAFA